MHRVSDCAGSRIGSPVTPTLVWPSASRNSIGTPNGLISQFDGWPACAPVNASAEALRPLPHDSGPGWLAWPFPYDSFIRYSLPVSRRTTRPANHVYLKIAYHLSQETRTGLTAFRIPRDFENKLFDFQIAAVKIAAHYLNKRGGTHCDVVGLGKTLMATAVARIFEDDHDLETLLVERPFDVGLRSHRQAAGGSTVLGSAVAKR